MTAHVGRSGMGSHKHGVSGHSGPSPRAKLMMAMGANRLAEQQMALKKRTAPAYATVRDALKGRKA